MYFVFSNYKQVHLDKRTISCQTDENIEYCEVKRLRKCLDKTMHLKNNYRNKVNRANKKIASMEKLLSYSKRKTN